MPCEVPSRVCGRQDLPCTAGAALRPPTPVPAHLPASGAPAMDGAKCWRPRGTQSCGRQSPRGLAWGSCSSTQAIPLSSHLPGLLEPLDLPARQRVGEGQRTQLLSCLGPARPPPPRLAVPATAPCSVPFLASLPEVSPRPYLAGLEGGQLSAIAAGHDVLIPEGSTSCAGLP